MKNPFIIVVLCLLSSFLLSSCSGHTDQQRQQLQWQLEALEVSNERLLLDEHASYVWNRKLAENRSNSIEKGRIYNEHRLHHKAHRVASRTLTMIEMLQEEIQVLAEFEAGSGTYHEPWISTAQFWWGESRRADSLSLLVLQMEDSLNAYLQEWPMWANMKGHSMGVSPLEKVELRLAMGNCGNPDEVSCIFHSSTALEDLVSLAIMKARICTAFEAYMNLKAAQYLKTGLSQWPTYTAEQVPQSYSVVAGSPFEAKVFLSHMVHYDPAEYMGSGSFRIDESGRFAVQTIPTSMEDLGGADSKEMTYDSKVIRLDEFGNKEEFPLHGSYLLHRPAIEVSTPASGVLFRHCRNPIQIRMPSLGEDFHPTFKVSDASVVWSPMNPHEVIVNPAGKSCTLDVYNSANGTTYKVGSLQFEVVESPPPTVEILVDGQPWNGLDYISKKSMLEALVMPDRLFQSLYPEEAQYTWDQTRVYAFRHLGNNPLLRGSYRHPQNGKMHLHSFRSDLVQDLPGTVVMLEWNGIKRIKSDGEEMPVNMKQNQRRILFRTQ